MPGPANNSFGNIILEMVLKVTMTPASVSTVTVAEQTFTVNGLLVGDIVQVIPSFAWTGLTSIASARVTAANTLAIAFSNSTAGSLTPPAGAYVLNVVRPTFLDGASLLPSAIV